MMGLKFTDINLQKLPLSKIVAVGAIIWAIMATKGCNGYKLEVSQNNGIYIEAYQNQAKKFTVEKNAANQEVATQTELVEKVRGEADELRKSLSKQSLLNYISRNVSATSVGDLSGTEAMFVNPVASSTNSMPSMIPINTEFIDTNKWYTIKGRILNDRIKFDTLLFRNSIIINYGEKRDKGLLGYLKKPKSVVEVINESPYAKTSEIKNITFKQKRIKPVVWVAAGFVGGMVAMHYIR